jgi:hypothetical protein
MIEGLFGVIVGAVGASIAWFFIARNNKEKALKVIQFDIDTQLDKIIAKARQLQDAVSDEIEEIAKEIKKKIKK